MLFMREAFPYHWAMLSTVGDVFARISKYDGEKRNYHGSSLPGEWRFSRVRFMATCFFSFSRPAMKIPEAQSQDD